MLYYDINCKYKTNFERRNHGKLPQLNIYHIIPEFHVYAHMAPCPTLYHPKMNPVCGAVEGEATERWWSTLGKFDLITREMLNTNRHEQLEDVNLYIRSQKLKNLFKSLLLNQKKAITNLSFLTTALGDLDESILNDLWLQEKNETLEKAIGDINLPGKKVVAVQIQDEEIGK